MQEETANQACQTGALGELLQGINPPQYYAQPGDVPPAPNRATGFKYGDPCIKKAENGYLVHVGCKTFVFKYIDEVSDALYMYDKDPDAAYKNFCKGAK